MEGNWLDEDTDLKSAGRNCFGGSSPSPSAIKLKQIVNKFYADIAQLVEQLTCNEKVGSSSLSVGTNF